MHPLAPQIARETFGAKIRKMRTAESLTRSQIELLCGISTSTLKGIESGKHYPSFDALRSLVNHFDFQKYCVWLLFDLEYDNLLPSDIKQISPKQKLAEDLGIPPKQNTNTSSKHKKEGDKEEINKIINDLNDEKKSQLMTYAKFLLSN